MDRPPKPGTQNRVFNPLFIVPGFMPGMCYGCQRTLLELMRQRTKKNPVKPCGLTGLMYFLVLPWILMWCRDQDLNQGHTDFQSVALPTELSRHTQQNSIFIAKNAGSCQAFSFSLSSSSSSSSKLKLSKAVPVFMPG